MALLQQRGRERARASILRRVEKGVLTLEAMEELRDEYEGRKRLAERRIRVCLETRKVGVRIAIEKIGDAAEVAGRIDKEFEALRVASSEAKRLVIEFPRSELEEARAAIRNLRSLLVQIDFYSSIPTRCRSLRQLLAAAPHRYLKEVYKRSMELEIWRLALNREVCVASHRARIGESKKNAELGALAKILGSHFADVSRLVAEVFSVLHATLNSTESLASREATHLVACAEVVEMHELLQTRLVADATRDALRFGEEPAAAVEKLRASPAGAASRDDALAKLYDAARRRAAELFAEHHLRFADEDYSQTSALLGAATKLVADLDATRKRAAPCVPDSWNLVRLVRAAYETHVHRQLSPLWGKTTDLEVADLIEVAEWLDYYNAVIDQLDPPGGGEDDDAAAVVEHGRVALRPRGKSESFRAAGEKMMRAYLDRITAQVEGWFASIRTREATLRQAADGQWLTTRPEDMFLVVSTQIAVAKEHAARAAKANSNANQHVATVSLRCLEELRADAARSLDKVDACVDAISDVVLRGLAFSFDEESMSFRGADDDDDVEKTAEISGGGGSSSGAIILKVEQLCAIANDSLRVQERCEDVFLSELDRGVSLQSVQSVLKDVVADYGDLAVRACEAAAAVPFLDLRETLSHEAPGSAAWQNRDPDQPDAVDVALETIDEYLADFREWLPEVLVTKVSRAAFERLVVSYVDGLLRSSAVFSDADAAAQNLLRDQNKILHYFFPHGASGLRDPAAVADRLEILRVIADVVAANPPDFPRYALEHLVAEFGTDTQAVLLSLVSRHPAVASTLIISQRRTTLVAQTKRLLQDVVNAMPDGPALSTTLPSRFAPLTPAGFRLLRGGGAGAGAGGGGGGGPAPPAAATTS
ncbi:hypothetical protein CTAYLR_001696 [Chrysophaeum taylorii]|uniref:Exocyst complex component Sec6 n=1 Tax=Chrysophaeum taylorii TaxID=2483200 RepID=A0AAD7U7N5_9STRA|nr:hypothetical protein CTAYLR_001696 [Chrysophaeum taylorii]